MNSPNKNTTHFVEIDELLKRIEVLERLLAIKDGTSTEHKSSVPMNKIKHDFNENSNIATDEISIRETIKPSVSRKNSHSNCIEEYKLLSELSSSELHLNQALTTIVMLTENCSVLHTAIRNVSNASKLFAKSVEDSICLSDACAKTALSIESLTKIDKIGSSLSEQKDAGMYQKEATSTSVSNSGLLSLSSDSFFKTSGASSLESIGDSSDALTARSIDDTKTCLEYSEEYINSVYLFDTSTT